MKSGFIAIIGRPNVGKSTLLNGILGEKVAIATEKPQTTRNTIRGIHTTDDCQMIFLDTPGIHRPRTKLGHQMTDSAIGTFNEVDLLFFLVDGPPDQGPGDPYIINLLKETKTPKFLLINKMDTMDPLAYKSIVEAYEKIGLFDEIIGISALKEINLSLVVEKAQARLAPGPMYFPEDMVTDHPQRFIVAELLREKLLLYLQEEIPHGVAVVIESYEEIPTITKISAVIYCEKKSHKGIIIGKQGRKLKGVGKSAREEMEALLGCKVFLQLWVKVRENWRDNDMALNQFGYKENGK